MNRSEALSVLTSLKDLGTGLVGFLGEIQRDRDARLQLARDDGLRQAAEYLRAMVREAGLGGEGADLLHLAHDAILRLSETPYPPEENTRAPSS